MNICLANLLADIAVVEQDLALTHIALDSREISEGGVFFALAGSQQHGLLYADQVIRQGAVAIVYDPAEQGVELAKNIHNLPIFAVVNLDEKLGEIASRFYQQATESLNIVGITGTNGKTSCSQFLAQVMPSCAVIGTLGWGLVNDLQSTCNTTPDAFALHSMLAKLLDQGINNVAMEVSSHGLQQGRVNAVKFNGVIFNNLSRDHLDYHISMEDYFQAKLRLVQWPDLKFVVVNLDDAYAERVLAAINKNVRVLTYSLNNKAYVEQNSIRVSDINYALTGICCDIYWQEQQAKLNSGLLGDFNLQNILAVLAVLLAQGMSLDECLAMIKQIEPVPGRMECFTGGVERPMVVVDYAHTPDALSKVLNTLRQHCTAKLIVVFGCGGDRDKGKRGEMGHIAEQLADQVVITDDNPRFEASKDIINDIISGLVMDNVKVINDRKAAIEYAIVSSSKFDIVLVAGKGHEGYQDIKGVKHVFNDRDIVQELLAA